MDGVPQHQRRVVDNTAAFVIMLVVTFVVAMVASIACIYPVVLWIQCDEVRHYVFAWHDTVENIIRQ